MIRILEFFTNIFYRYYDKGWTQGIAYESALLAITAIAYMNLIALSIFLGIYTSKYLIILIPLYLVFWFLLPRRIIEKKKYSSKSLKIGGISIILYILISMVLVIFLAKNKNYFPD